MLKTIYSDEHKFTITKLIRARADAGLSQVEVAALLHKTQSHISKIEAGQRRIDIAQLKEFARIFGKPIDYFIR